MVDKVDVIIVGAGPAGCKVGEIVSKRGYEVLILEEHTSVGEPVQCTGLVSNRIGKLPKEVIINKIKKARFFSGKVFFEVKSKDMVYVIDRMKYDNFLASKAKQNGCEFNFSTRFLDFQNRLVKTNKKIFETKILVGADGPNSSVAKSVGLKLPDNLLFGIQSTVEGTFESDAVELHFGSKVTPDLFAWVVPENERTARIGLLANKNPSRYFEKFLKNRIGITERKATFGDTIRYGMIKKSVVDNVLLVGDAACQVKPFSAGGIVYGQIGANLAGKTCIKAIEENNFSKKFLSKNYDEKWKKELANPIRKGLLMKKIFSKIQDRPFSFKLVKSLEITRLSNFFDMDFLDK